MEWVKSFWDNEGCGVRIFRTASGVGVKILGFVGFCFFWGGGAVFVQEWKYPSTYHVKYKVSTEDFLIK